ncbi:MAG: hypothetical protein ACQETG_08960 [Thermodesulfobacteriota bacterium]
MIYKPPDSAIKEILGNSETYVRLSDEKVHKMGNGGDAGIRTPDAADMSRML